MPNPRARQHAPNDTPYHSTRERNFIHSLFLIVIETLLTFLLKHDRQSRLHAQHLIKQKTVVCIKTHLPSDMFFVTFAPQGVLFDFELPHGTSVDATVTASSIDLMRAFFTARPVAFDKISITGETQAVTELKHLMHFFNVPQIVSDWRHWFNAGSQDITPASQQMQPLLRRIDAQRLEISNLLLNTKQQAYQLRQIKTHYRIWISVLGLVIFLLLLALLGLWHFGR